MISSGIKRGLAVSAVSALALTGIASMATSASAVPGSDQAGGNNAVQLVSPGAYTGGGVNVITTRPDGTNDTYRLEAAGGANVVSVRFAYQRTGVAPQNDASPVTIGSTTRNDNGFFSAEWNGADPSGDAIANGTPVTITATGLDSNGATLTNESFATTISNAASAINLADGTNLGVFQQPYAGEGNSGRLVRLRGTNSQPGGSGISCYVWDPAALNLGAGPTCSGASQNAEGPGSTFDFFTDITGYPALGATNEILLGVDNFPGGANPTGDVEGYTLYSQTVTTVTAAPAAATSPALGTAPIVVTVNDQNGQPISGAQVFASNRPTTAGNAFYTGSDGTVTIQQAPGTTTYFANADDVNAYDTTQGDKISGNVVVTPIAAVASTLTASSRDGAQFDFDENTDNVDITVQVKDQGGNNFDSTGQQLNYHWEITPFTVGAPVVRVPAAAESVGVPVPGSPGRYGIAFPEGAVPGGGTYRLVGSLAAAGLRTTPVAESTLLTVKSGQAVITNDVASPSQAQIGSTKSILGKLALSDGTGLPGRAVRIDVATAGNAGVVRPNGTTAAFAELTTGADGGFTANIRDRATPNTPEDATVTVTTQPGTSDQDDPAATPKVSVVQFVATTNTPGITLTDNNVSSTPGVAESFTVDVNDLVQGGTPVANQTVNLTVDKGFFTDGTPDPAPAAGADAGELKSLGQTIQVTTDANGDADFLVAIERDAGFDDDGLVTAKITASASGSTATSNQIWDSSDPLNGGAVTIDRSSAANQTVGILPKAPTNENVFYDVVATDQFGNRTDSPVVVAADLGSVNGVQGGDVVDGQFTTEGPAVRASSATAGTQTLTATWNTRTTKYQGNPLTETESAPPNGETLTDTGEATNFYVIDFAASKYSLVKDTGASLPVGSTVIYTYTATDQNGEPIAGVLVNFFRTGPDVLQDGTPATVSINIATNQQGRAQYVFSGAAAGKADIVALVTDSNGADGQPDRAIPQSRATDTVTFTGAAPGGQNQAAVNAKVSGKSVGNKDQIRVKAGAVANGAVVTVYKKVGGKKVEVRSSVLNGAGNKTIKVKDRNGNKVTKYIVIVSATADSQQDKSRVNIK